MLDGKRAIAAAAAATAKEMELGVGERSVWSIELFLELGAVFTILDLFASTAIASGELLATNDLAGDRCDG